MSDRSSKPDLTAEQLRFQAFYDSKVKDQPLGWGRTKDGRYFAPYCQLAWEAWQEAQRPQEASGLPLFCCEKYQNLVCNGACKESAPVEPPQPSEARDPRPCTCHPDDNPPVPCPRKYALSECRAAHEPPQTAARVECKTCYDVGSLAQFLYGQRVADTPCPDCRPHEPQGWQPIETAPKDGTRIYITRESWDSAPVAKWGLYPGNPVESDDGADVYMQGWIIEDEQFCRGCEDGFLGWQEDIADGVMPTHWSTIPGAPVTKGETP